MLARPTAEMFNSEDLETTLVKKDMEWNELQSLHIKQLEAALKEATTELGDQRKQFQCLQEDFQFNLKLLKERDHTLECYDAVVSTFQANDCTRQREVSELHLHVNKLQDAVRQGKRQCTALQTTHQQKMAELHLHLTTLCREKNEEIQKLKEENESLKSSIRLRIEEAEGTLVLQKQEMMAKFDAEMKKQEHEFNLRIKDMSSEVLSHKLKVELMKKELEVHTRGHSEALQASEDQCYQAHEEIKQRDLVLTNTISMKDTRIQELMDQLRQTEDKHEREEEKARRKFAMLDSNYRERETALAEMRDIHAKRLCEAETRRRDLQTQLNVLLDEQTMRDKSHNRQLQQKDQEILELRRELESTRCSWDTYITKMSKDMVVKDTELLTAREQETKLKTELDRYIEDVKRYKQQLVSGLNREQSLEQRLVQLDLDWKKRCENVWAEDYVKDKELIEGFTLSRDKGDSQQTPDHSSPSSEMCELQKQNASLCAVVAEMRKEMETLAREIPVVATVRQTEDKKIQTGRLQVEKMTNVAALQEKQARMENAVAHFLQQSPSTLTKDGELLHGLFSRNEEDGKNGQKSSQDHLKGPAVTDSTPPDKLRQAVWLMSRLGREKQQLIELGNCLRAQLSKAKVEGKGLMQGCGDLSTLERLQYQLTSQELQYAQRDHSSMSPTMMKPLFAKNQHKNQHQAKQSYILRQCTVSRQQNSPASLSPISSLTVPSAHLTSSLNTDASLQDVWQILDKGPSPSILTPIASTD